MHSDADSVAEYLAGLPDDRRAPIAAVRDVIVGNLPDGYVEAMRWGMISYEVPLARYPDTYNRQPLSFVALASQARHMALYLNCLGTVADGEERFAEQYRATGKRLDMGKSCVRFRKLDDLPLDLVGATIAGTSVDAFIAQYEASRP